METVRDTFQSFDEYLDVIDATPTKWSRSHTGRIQHISDFYGLSYDEAVRTAKEGWHEGTENFVGKIMEAKEKGFGRGKRAEFEYDVQGFRPDVGLFCAGEPGHMMSWSEGDKLLDKVVHIQTERWINCSTSHEQFTNWGAALCILIDTLESAGISVQLDAVQTTASDKRAPGAAACHILTVTIKQAGEPLDIDRMAFMLSHVSSTRRLGWQTMEWHRELEGDLSGAYGYAGKEEQIPGSIRIESIHIGNNQSIANSLEDSCARVLELYNEAQAGDKVGEQVFGWMDENQTIRHREE